MMNYRPKLVLPPTRKFPWLTKYLPLVVLGISLSVLLMQWRLLDQSFHRTAEGVFDEIASDITNRIVNHLHEHEQVLLGGVGLFNAQGEVTRSNWRHYISSLQLDQNHPGVLGVGYSAWLNPSEVAENIRSVRAEGFPEYLIKPEGQRPVYTSIMYLEPFNWRNQRAFGYDMYTEKIRRSAMDKAIDSGLTTVAAKIILVQETDKDRQNGMLMYAPVYRQGAATDTVEHRRKALRGFVYTPLRMNDFIYGTLGKLPRDVAFEVYADTNRSADSLMFSSIHAEKNELPRQYVPEFTREIKVEAYGRNWMFYYSSLPAYALRLEKEKSNAVLGISVFTSILLALISFLLLNDREKALHLADKMARDARASETRYLEIMREQSIILDNSPIAISLVVDRKQVWINHKTEEIFLYSRDELVNSDTRKLYHDQEVYDRLDADAYPVLAQGLVFEADQELVRRDGVAVLIRCIGKAIDPEDMSKGTIWLMEDITYRKQVEDALRQSEAFTAATLDALAAHICVLDEQGVIISVNRGWKEFATANPPLVENYGLGANYFDICAAFQGEGQRFAEGLRAVQSGEREIYDQEYSCDSPWEQRWFKGRVTRFADYGQLRLVVSHENITKSKELALNLRESEARFRLLFEQHSAVMLLVNPVSLRIKDANLAAAEFYGYTRYELQGMNINQINCLTPDEITLEMQQVENHDRKYFVFPHRLAGGEMRTVEVHSTPIIQDGNSLLFSIIHDITDRLRAEEETRQKSAWLTALKERSPVAILVANSDRVIVDTNPSFCEIFGYNVEELVGNATRIIHASESSAREFGEKFYPIIRDGQQVRAEYQFRRKNGELFWADVTGQAIVPGNLTEGTIWQIGDISAQRRLQLELLRLTCEQRAVLDATRVGITMVKSRMLVWANRAMGEIFGYSIEEMTYLTTRVFYRTEEEYDKLGTEAYSKLAEGLDYQIELQMKHNNGAPVWIRLQGKALDPEKLEEGSVWVFTNIDGQKTMEAERQEQETRLRLSETKYSTIFSTTPDLIAISARESGRFLEVNDAFERIMGFTKEEVIGRTVQELGTWASFEDRKRLLAELGERRRLVEQQARFRRKNGEAFPVSLSLALVEVTGEECIIICARDITDQVRAQEELQQSKVAAETASHAKSEFLANMSHEIRTPMGAIIGFGDLIMQTELTARQQDYLTKINTSARLLLSLINDILDISKVEAGKLILEQVEFALTECVDKVSDIIAVQAHAKGLEFRCKIAADVSTYVTGDPLRLRQILLNLLGNAVKFTESGSVGLVVSNVEPASSEGITLQFQISDTGIGMTKAQCATIFDAFTQADSSTTRTFGGTGLGLAISKQLVTLMGGVILIESQPGKGSVFSFTAQFASATAGNSRAPLSPTCYDLRVLRGARVLVVEDNAINQQLARLQLSQCGIVVTIASNGREALETVSHADEPFDVILMDIQMPEMDGYEATRHLRDQWTPTELPIIALTAHAFVEEQVKCQAAGMNDHLSKPIDVSALHKVLLRWIKPRQELTDVTETQNSAATHTEVQNFPGLHIDEALARMGGDRSAYRSLLRRFISDYQKVAEHLEDLLHTGDLTRTRLMAHTLKGVAGNLGAVELAQVAGALETVLRGQNPAEAHEIMAGIKERLAIALDSIEAYERSLPAEQPDSVEPLADHELLDLAREMTGLMIKRDLQALKHFKKLHASLVQLCPPHAVETLTECIDRLDFAGALVVWKKCQPLLSGETPLP